MPTRILSIMTTKPSCHLLQSSAHNDTNIKAPSRLSTQFKRRERANEIDQSYSSILVDHAHETRLGSIMTAVSPRVALLCRFLCGAPRRPVCSTVCRSRCSSSTTITVSQPAERPTRRRRVREIYIVSGARDPTDILSNQTIEALWGCQENCQ